MDRSTEFGHLVALDICNELLALCREARERKVAAHQANDDAHAEFQRQYHLLEVRPAFNAAEGYRMAKSFRDTLRRRRQAKWDAVALEKLAPIVLCFEDQLRHCAVRLKWYETGCQRYVAGVPFADKGEEAAD